VGDLVTTYLQYSALDLNRLVTEVTDRERGGVVTFLGMVRNHHDGRQVLRLEYSAYEAMAEAECARIVAEAEGRWPARVALAHRLGALAIGDAAVAIATAAAHRAEAFDACRYVIEEIKSRVPIWKKEFYGDGTVAWVDPTLSRGRTPAERPAAESRAR
jgi:molybdopterin synthase catalytic subunit